MCLFRKNKIGRSSIKESLDNLPSGICFARTNGVIVLCNRKMYTLARELLGRDLQHLSELQASLISPDKAVTPLNPEHSIYLFPDGTVWQFTESNITDENGSSYILIASADVTELYRKETELKRENAELERINARARALYAQIEQTVRDEENLALKAKIHDDLGMALLKSRQVLAEKSTLDEMRLMGVRWAHIAETLGIGESEAFTNPVFSLENEITELTELTKDIGIALHIDGKLPQGETNARLLIAAIRECTTNAIRHAEANEMWVSVTDEGGKIKAEITNNGKVPEKEIIEGGGLSSLRSRIEQTDGVMEIQSQPQFALRLTLNSEQ